MPDPAILSAFSLPSRIALISCIVASASTAIPAATPRPVSDIRRETPVDFEREILPVLQKNCLACHNQTRAKADLVLETPASILKGGASGAGLVPGKGAESLVFKSAAHLVDDLVMPPAGNKSNAIDLSSDELGLLRLWIDQGAKGEVRGSSSLAWQAIPTSWSSSYAVALDRHGRLAAYARANRVQLYDVQTGRIAGQLQDPELDGAAQRDVVAALAFSPTEDVVATAGFREVRLWRRRPPAIQELVRPESGERWIAASISPDRRTLALVTESGDIQLRQTDSGVAVRTWQGVTTTPALVAYSPDGTQIAVAGASGNLRLISLNSEGTSREHTLGGGALALAWFDGGRAIATVLPGAKTIQTWTVADASGATPITPSRNLTAHEATITSLATSATGTLLSGDQDGTVLQWSPSPDASPASIKCGSAITRIEASHSGTRVVAGLAAGGSAVLDFGDKPAVLHRLSGDLRLTDAVRRLQHELGLSRLELGFAEKAIQDADSEAKKAGETLTKAREKKDGQAKALTEKQQGLAQQQQAETAALKERDDLTAELQRITDESTAAEKLAAEARVAARDASDRAAVARSVAEQADRLKSDLDRIMQSLAGRAEETSITKAREAAESAAADAAAKTRLTGEARTLAEKALDELANRSFAAGQRKAAAERANADLPPRRKQAEDRAAVAKKAADELKPQIEKARITLEGGEKDVQLAEQGADRAAKALAKGKESAETARNRIADAETRLKERQTQTSAADGHPHMMGQTTPGGAFIALEPDGSLMLWDVPSGAPSLAFAFPGPQPLSLTVVSDDVLLVVRPDGVSRIDLAPRWDRFRTLGGSGESASSNSAFVDRVNALAFSPDGTLLATGGGDPSRSGELKLWHVADGTLVRDFGAIHSDCVLSIAFSPRGERIATGGADRFARISEVGTGKVLRSLEGHTHHVMSVAWLAHGGILASGGAEGMVKIWNPYTGDRLKNVEGFGKEVTGLSAVGLTNQFVAIAGSGQGRIVRENGEKVRDLPAATSYLQGLAVTDDGRWAAISADDGIFRLWDVENAKERFAIQPEK